jgi:hypothetical protein
MIERLTDQQLRAWRDRRDPSGQLIHDYPTIGLTDDILVLRARVAKLEAAINDFLRNADGRLTTPLAAMAVLRAPMSEPSDG